MTLMLVWNRGPAVAQLVASKFPFIQNSGGFGPCFAVGIVDIEKRHYCGGAVLCPRGGGFDGEITIYLEPGYTFNRRILRDLFDFCFNKLKLVSITCLIARSNKRGRRLAEGLGFRYEGCMKLALDGKQNACVYGMLKDECKWIKENGLKTTSAS